MWPAEDQAIAFALNVRTGSCVVLKEEFTCARQLRCSWRLFLAGPAGISCHDGSSLFLLGQQWPVAGPLRVRALVVRTPDRERADTTVTQGTRKPAQGPSQPLDFILGFPTNASHAQQ